MQEEKQDAMQQDALEQKQDLDLLETQSYDGRADQDIQYVYGSSSEEDEYPSEGEDEENKTHPDEAAENGFMKKICMFDAMNN